MQECKNKRYKQIKCFDEKLKQIDESFKNLNDDLNEWFFKDIRFEKITNSHYKTQRQDCNGAYFDCKSGLSEGEKTIVSMIYFVNSYLASLSNLQECPLLIIDDPVTSLDSQNKEKIVNYISNKIFSNLRGQVFILSHDKEIVKKFSKKVNNENNVFCIEKTNLKSNIKPATSDMLFNNEIIEIYNKLKKYIEAPNENYTIIDLSRKLLEKLFVVFYGEKCENFTDCYNDLLKKFGLIAKYTASDIQELNHNKSDRDIFAELPQKVEFVLEIFEKATKRNG